MDENIFRKKKYSDTKLWYVSNSPLLKILEVTLDDLLIPTLKIVSTEKI